MQSIQLQRSASRVLDGANHRDVSTGLIMAIPRPPRPRDAKCPLLVSDVLLSHGLLRSTIGARGLNFRVRNGTGCASPAMVADQQGAFCCQGRLRAVPWGPHSVTSDALSGSLGPDEEEKSSAD